MKRQDYFPSRLANQPEWLVNYATRLLEFGPALGIAPATVAASVMDALYLAHALGDWITAVRDYGPGCTAALETLMTGTGTAPFDLPEFAAPMLPPAAAPLPAVVPVAPGALDRVFKQVQAIKAAPTYTQDTGLLMGIVGSADTVDNPVPTFSLQVEQGGGCQCVKITFKKFGRMGVAIYSKRGGTDWAFLGIDTATPYLDERPLLVASQPEVREYRLRYWDKGVETGDWTDVASVVIAP